MTQAEDCKGVYARVGFTSSRKVFDFKRKRRVYTSAIPMEPKKKK